jgi:ABC-2 type transport system permease protein
MSSATYVRYEVLRSVRNKRFFLFSLAFPVALYVLSAAGNGDTQDFANTGVPFYVYYMAGMIAWGSMSAVLAGGARIAAERSVGWVRQLRISPLSTKVYFTTKVVTGYLVAGLTILALAVAGTAFGVRLEWGGWLRMIVLVLAGLVPFAAIGIWLGHVLTIDSMGPALGGTTAVFALLGGAFGPLGAQDGWFHELSELLPSYWLVQAGHSAFTGEWWPPKAWVVLAVWTVVFVRLARRAYLNDTLRV